MKPDLSRRGFAQQAAAALVGGMVIAKAIDATGTSAGASGPSTSLGRAPKYPRQDDPAAALEYLLYGNRNYACGKPRNPRRDRSRRRETESIQKPIAVIVSCADSKVPVEVLFEVGIGDVFVVRVVGNTLGYRANGADFILNNMNVGSISYALQNLGPIACDGAGP